MWWAGASVDLFLGAARVLVVQGSSLLLDQPVAGPEEGLQTMAGRLSALPQRPRASLWLGGALCRPVMVHEPMAFRAASEFDAAVEALGRSVLGAGGVRAWVPARWRQPGPCLVAVSDADTMTRAEGLLGPRVRGALRIAPWWADAVGLVSGDSGWLVVEDGDSLTALQCSGGKVVQARTSAPVSSDAAAPTLMRWRASGDLPREGVRHLRLRSTPPDAGVPPAAVALGCMGAVS